ncbi:unnamed protein product, partial [Phaeothamnion confervicola]
SSGDDGDGEKEEGGSGGKEAEKAAAGPAAAEAAAEGVAEGAAGDGGAPDDSGPAWGLNSRSAITVAAGSGPAGTLAVAGAGGGSNANGTAEVPWPQCVLRQPGGLEPGMPACSICCGSCGLYATLLRHSRGSGRSSPMVGAWGGGTLAGASTAAAAAYYGGCGDDGGLGGGDQEAAELAAARVALLNVVEAVPSKAWMEDAWATVSLLTWRAFVRHATTARALLQAQLLMESNVESGWLARWWNQAWQSPAVAMRLVTTQAVAFRIYAFDSALSYEGRVPQGPPMAPH